MLRQLRMGFVAGLPDDRGRAQQIEILNEGAVRSRSSRVGIA